MNEANKNSLYLLEQKKIELDTAQSEIETLKYEQSSTNSKVRFEKSRRCLIRIERDFRHESPDWVRVGKKRSLVVRC